MGNAGTNGGTREATTAGGGRARGIALWAVQVLLAVVFAMAGLSKVFGDPVTVEMFATIGVGQWFRYVVGALEIVGAVGVLIPRLSALSALGLVGLMAGAALVSVSVLGANPLPPLSLLVVCVLVVWGRWPGTGASRGGPAR